MANINFTSLPAVANATLADVICAVQGTTSVKQTLAQIVNLVRENNILTYAGNPNGNLAGDLYELCWDTSNSNLYLCTTAGVAALAVWTLIATSLASTLVNFLKSPTSANLAAAVTNETGTGSLVFNTSPTLTTPAITGGTINNAAIGGVTPLTGVFTTLQSTGLFTPTGGIAGITNASSAASGIVGQVISSIIASGSAVALTTATPLNVTSIALTAGDWDVYAKVLFSVNAATTITKITGAISLTSNTLSTTPENLNESTTNLEMTFTTGKNNYLSICPVRINVSTTTNVYLIASSDFAVNTCSAYGAIWARRVR